jgi:hypothetical protein
MVGRLGLGGYFFVKQTDDAIMADNKRILSMQWIMQEPAVFVLAGKVS